MPPRRITGLVWAEWASSPWPASRPRGAKGAGLRYERRVAKATKGDHGRWLRFCDANGTGYCSPDILLWQPPPAFGGPPLTLAALIVLECKLTWTPEAEAQLTGLYCPILAHLYPETPIRGVVVVRALTPDAPRPVHTLREALADGPTPKVLHWLGQGRFPWGV